MESEIFKKGIAKRRKVLGDKYVDHPDIKYASDNIFLSFCRPLNMTFEFMLSSFDKNVYFGHLYCLLTMGLFNFVLC